MKRTDKTKGAWNMGIPSTEPQKNCKFHLYSMGKKYYIHPTEYLTPEQVEKIFTACEKAYALDIPLNRFITIHYDDYADEKRPQKFMTDILEKSRKWLKRRGLPVAYIYVLENGKIKGIHAHILLHIPTHYQIAYKRALRKWIPFEWTRTRIVIRTIKYPHYGELAPLNSIYGTLRYMCKGLNPQAPIRGITPRNQGKIFGQRYGISLSLKTAMKNSDHLQN